MSRSYTPSSAPFKVDDTPRVMRQELARIASVISMLRNIEVSGQYDISAGASVTIADGEVATAGLALIVADGSAVPGSVVVSVNRTGTGNGCYRVSPEYAATSTASANWGIGLTTEPTDGADARVWVESTSANAKMVVKLVRGTTRTVRVYSLRT